MYTSILIYYGKHIIYDIIYLSVLEFLSFLLLFLVTEDQTTLDKTTWYYYILLLLGIWLNHFIFYQCHQFYIIKSTSHPHVLSTSYARTT